MTRLVKPLAKGDITVLNAKGIAVTVPVGADTTVLTADSSQETGVGWAAGGVGGGAPTTADYLTGTAQAGLSAEIVVGTTPGGELGGTWASPTVDASHSGSTHAAVQAAAEATAAADVSTHAAISAASTHGNLGHANTNDPTANQKAALAGTGTPSGTDKYVNDSDARMTNARTPTAHASTHATGQSDAVTITHAQTTGQTANDHHAQLHHAAHEPGGGDAMATDAAAGTASLRSLGTTGTTAAAGNDSRLSDARTPTAHASTHTTGTDKIATGTPTGTKFLRDDFSWAAPSASGVTKISGNTGAFVADTTWETLTSDSAGNTTVTPAVVMTVTGLGAGTYRIKGTLVWKTAATTTGIAIVLNHTGTLTQFVSTWWTTTTGTTASTGVADQVTTTAAGQLVEGKSERVKDTKSSALAGTDTANGTQLSVIEAILIVSVSGDLQLKIASGVAGSAATLLAGSTLEVNKVV